LKPPPQGQGIKPPGRGLLYAGPIGLWFTAFFLAPLAIILVTSFLRSASDGTILAAFNFDSYLSLFRPALGKVGLRTLWVSVVSTIAVILIAMPCGYYMARSKWKDILLILIIIPFWTNYIIRIFAWKRLLDSSGFLNQIIMFLKLSDEPLPLMRNWISIIVINVYTYLPYAILPLYSSMEKFDFALLDAARDLGANKIQSMVKVLLPNVSGGITTSVFFTFIPLLGSFVVQQLAGNKDMYMLGNIIQDRVKNRNLPLASAISIFIMIFTTAGIYLILYMNKRPAKSVVADTLADQGIKESPFALPIGGGGKGKA
jgi:spermidine/putrescine transport system permease protein